MPSKKPSPAPSTIAKPSTRPQARKGTLATPPNPRHNRWQRTKRYGWDSR